MRNIILLTAAFYGILGLSSFECPQRIIAVSSIDTSLIKHAEQIKTDADLLMPSAANLVKDFEGYISRAGLGCPKAKKEAEDGMDMSRKAVRDIEAAKTLAQKVYKAKKDKDAEKDIDAARKKIHNARFYIREAEDRRKETEFELRGCHQHN